MIARVRTLRIFFRVSVPVCVEPLSKNSHSTWEMDESSALDDVIEAELRMYSPDMEHTAVSEGCVQHRTAQLEHGSLRMWTSFCHEKTASGSICIGRKARSH